MEKKDTQLAPIGRLLNVIEAAGFKLEYQYDDLVFIDNTSLLFRFDQEKPDTVYLHFNVESEPTAQLRLTEFFSRQAKIEGITIKASSQFQFEQIKGEEEITITFKES
jgi:hypothetical protein